MEIDVNGIELHWEEHGEGEPLLWLHGGMGHGADWKFIFKEPPAGYRLIAPDLRGHGASTDPSCVFTFRQCALDILALLGHLKIPRVKAIGLSAGGIVLLHMSTTKPTSVESMVIVSAPTHFPDQARVIMRQFSEAMVGEAEMARMRERHKRGEPQIRQLFAMAQGFANSHNDVNFTTSSLSTIRADTLIVFGDRDPFYPVSIATDMQRAIERSYLWVVPNGAHGPVFDDAAPQFVATAMQFLQGAWR